jgi:uncharacterized coiled-coil protein SlyX
VSTWPHDDNDIAYEPPEVPEKRRGPLKTVAVGLAIVGIGAAFAWRVYFATPYPLFAFGRSASVTEPNTVALVEFRAFQQQTVAQLQSIAQGLAAQQAEAKRLSDQMTAVSAKLDALHSAISSARADIPAEPNTRPQPKKPAKPKGSSDISTGGAPLQLAR